MSNSAAPTKYDRVMLQARALDVRDEHTRAQVADLERAMRLTARAAPERAWVRWLIPSIAAGLAAAVGFALATWRAPEPGPTFVAPELPGAGGSSIARLGPGLRVIAEPGTEYALRDAGTDSARLEIVTGAITVASNPGGSAADGEAHELSIAAGALVASAQSSVFSVGLQSDPAGAEPSPYVTVHRGNVEVRLRGARHFVASGDSWPSGRSPAAGEIRAAQILATSLQRDEPVAAGVPGSADSGVAEIHLQNDAGPATEPTARAERPDAREAAKRRASDVSGRPEPTRADKGTPRELWRRARLYRGQGRYGDALAVLEKVSASNDRTWAPLATVEAMRIYSDDLLRPKKAIRLGEQFVLEFPAHELRREVESLYCAAHGHAGLAKPARCR